MKYKCKKCKKVKEVFKGTITYSEEEKKVVCKQAKCCKSYMQEIEEKFNGFPTIHRNEYTQEDRIIQHKAKQKAARIKRDGYDKNNPKDR
tara:strand:- start:651 stop:920 length:270 start_codon:yes stop_codon:yes gene_type:complete